MLSSKAGAACLIEVYSDDGDCVCYDSVQYATEVRVPCENLEGFYFLSKNATVHVVKLICYFKLIF